jgi:hypothetical protein
MAYLEQVASDDQARYSLLRSDYNPSISRNRNPL